MTFDRLRDTWETLGRDDPLWAVLSDPLKHNNQWDSQEFFRTGREEVDSLFLSLERRGAVPRNGRCLDFGCGVGRVSQALSTYFDVVDGVDIAQSMVDAAEQFNQHGHRCRFHVNATDDLTLFADATFDFVYSNIVLQHMEADLAERYIAEFLRVLAPGGMAVFQVPSRFREIPKSGLASHHARLEVEGKLAFEVLNRVAVTVRVRNASPDVWPTSAPIQVGNHWLDDRGSMLVQDDGRSPLPEMKPGDERPVGVWVTAPARPGRYILELDLVEEGVTWFGDRGSTTARIAVDVSRPPLGKRLLRGLIRPNRRGSIRPDSGSPPVMEMHAVPTERVVAIATSAGGEVVDIENFEVSGPEWESYKYYIRKTA